MGDSPETVEGLRKRARDALIVVVASLFLLGIPFVFYFVPIFGFGGAWSAQVADRRLTKLKQKPTWAGALAVPAGILVGLIGLVFVAASVADTMDRISKARERTASERSQEAARRESTRAIDASVTDAAVDAPPPVPSDPAYLERLGADARKAGLEPQAAAQLTRAFPHFHTDDLGVWGSMAAYEGGLSLELGSHGGGKLRLRIEGLGGVAFRFTVACRLGEDARPLLKSERWPLVVAAGERVERVVCADERREEPFDPALGRKPPPTEVHVVLPELETIAVPELAVRYLALPCVPRELPGVAWRDLVDFYGRHPCTSYTMPADFHAFAWDGQRSLPAAPPKRR
jgi:hypothetical protein